MAPPVKLKLALHSIAPKTRQRYKAALRRFTKYLRARGTVVKRSADFDLHLAQYMDYGHDTGTLGRAEAFMTKSALEFFMPKLRRSLRLSNQQLAGWSRIKPPEPHEPIPYDLTLGIAHVFICQGHLDKAVGVLVSFQCYLRPPETLARTKSDFILADSPTEDDNGVLILTKPRQENIKVLNSEASDYIT